MSEDQNAPVMQDFLDVDADACAAAEAAAKQGVAGWSIPAGVAIGEPSGKKNQRHARWSESATIESAYRTVSKSGLLDVVIIAKSRTGMPNENKKNFFHLCINMECFTGMADEAAEQKHGRMTEQSLGAIVTLLKATGLFPTTGGMRASLLNMVFPPKGQPGAKSPLDGKSVVFNAHGTVEKKVTTALNKATGDIETSEIEDVRVQVDTFNPEG
jgi:hypothetical protein